MPKKPRKSDCFPKPKKGCSSISLPDARIGAGKDFGQKVSLFLKSQGAIASSNECKQFVEWLEHCIRVQKASVRLYSNTRRTDDIIGLIQLARNSGDLEEAVWRSFLAAHFGRTSSENHKQSSASDFLCAFQGKPFWTWKKVKNAPNELRKWLFSHADELKSLSFGNHRKYESNRPEKMWPVIKSFIELTEDHSGPVGVFIDGADDCNPVERFDLLFHRLRSLRQFGRTGTFDFLSLLCELGIFEIEPGLCYLRGATGPLKGAKKLWGNRRIGELEQLAADLAKELDLSPMVVEDALCMWQK